MRARRQQELALLRTVQPCQDTRLRAAEIVKHLCSTWLSEGAVEVQRQQRVSVVLHRPLATLARECLQSYTREPGVLVTKRTDTASCAASRSQHTHRRAELSTGRAAHGRADLCAQQAASGPAAGCVHSALNALSCSSQLRPGSRVCSFARAAGLCLPYGSWLCPVTCRSCSRCLLSLVFQVPGDAPC